MYSGLLNELFHLRASPNGAIGTAAVGTTNYDLVIERFGALSGIRVFDCYQGDPNTEKGTWDFEWGGTQDGIHLLKLHGSINWFVPRIEKYVVGDDILDIDTVRTPTGGRVAPDSKDYLDNILVYPGTKTDEQARKSWEPYSVIFSRFVDRLEDSSVCFVIGYSFRDELVNAYLEQFLGDPDDETCIYALSPSAEKDIRQNMNLREELLDRVRWMNRRFTLDNSQEWLDFARHAGEESESLRPAGPRIRRFRKGD
jgi:hypothetical protein